MTIPEIGATPEMPKQGNGNQEIDQEQNNNESIWVKFNDKDGKVDLSDAQYIANNGKTIQSSAIESFLKKHVGEKWDTLKELFTKLIDSHNLECELEEEMQEGLDDPEAWLNNFRKNSSGRIKEFRSSSREKFEKFRLDAESKFGILEQEENVNNDGVVYAQKVELPIETGDYFVVRNDDGTSFRVNLREKTITKLDSNGYLIAQRNMTEDEIKTPSNILTEQFVNSNISADNEVVPAKPAKSEIEFERKFDNESVVGAYSFVEKEDGRYEIQKKATVSAYRNQTCKAFKEGFDLMKVQSDDNGKCCFRGLKSNTKAGLQMFVDTKAEELAIYTEIYKDFKEKQASVGELTLGEQNFMEYYNNLLIEYELQMNEQGDLEDISSKKRRRN